MFKTMKKTNLFFLSLIAIQIIIIIYLAEIIIKKQKKYLSQRKLAKILIIVFNKVLREI
jgi:hypothetical protein